MMLIGVVHRYDCVAIDGVRVVPVSASFVLLASTGKIWVLSSSAWSFTSQLLLISL